ncbi:hypothetical protein BCT01_04530 [Vibrio tasmaniensis]|nr:hypothetical protein BCT01_04530 [Vibrio tasmaniensis]
MSVDFKRVFVELIDGFYLVHIQRMDAEFLTGHTSTNVGLMSLEDLLFIFNKQLLFFLINL